MRKTNIVLFSSGVSEKRGLLRWLASELEAKGCNCFCWKDLFRHSNDPNSIALLPMLIKKIPTFDFAILLCEGHDKTVVMREGLPIDVNVMRDNVLFEIGLCAVSLGLEKVILLADDTVRLPEDLMGLDGQLALKHITFPTAWNSRTVSFETLEAITDDIFNYIQSKQSMASPVIIGAAASTASGYVTNYIFKIIESISNGFLDKQSGEIVLHDTSKIRIHIHIPLLFSERTMEAAKKHLAKLSVGALPHARQRSLEFHYRMDNDVLVIEDYPTTLITSYNTAKAILKLSADDTADRNAERRFVEKELDLFESAMYSLLNEDYFSLHIRHFYPTLSKKNRIALETLAKAMFEKGITVIRHDY